VRFQHLRELIEQRLQTSPVLGQVLRRIPGDLDYPYWVTDSRLDIDYHVRHLALPHPGDWRQFCIQVARLHSRPLDTRRPLWEVYVIEGLNEVGDLPAGSFAIYFKVHHCAMDHFTAQEFLNSLHEREPNPDQHLEVSPRVRQPAAREPSAIEMAVHGLRGNVLRITSMNLPPWTHYRRLAHRLRVGGLRQLRTGTDVFIDSESAAHFASPPTAPRVFEGLKVSAALVQAMQIKAPGATLEDVVILLCTEATRRLLTRLGMGRPEHMVARVELPTRHAGAHALAGNHHGMREIEALCGVDDLIDRLTAMANRVEDADLDTAERQGQALRARYEGTPAVINRLLSQTSMRGGADEADSECVSVQLMHGPKTSRYLLGARLAGVTNLSPLLEGCSLAFSACCYDDEIFLSFTSDTDKLPEPRELREELKRLIHELAEKHSGTVEVLARTG